MTSGLSISILGLGLDTRFRSMLKVFFERRQSTSYQFVNQQADIVVADLDAIGVRSTLAEHHKQDIPKPTILFSIDENEYQTGGDFVVLRKPFTVKQLISAFDIIDLRFRVGRQRLMALSARGQTAPSVPPEERKPEAVPEPPTTPVVNQDAGTHYNAAASLSGLGDYVKLDTMLTKALDQSADKSGSEYDVNGYLQGALLKAYRDAQDKNKNILLEFGSGTISIDVKRSLVQMGMGGFQLRELASFPLSTKEVNISLVPGRQAMVDPESGRTILSVEALIWKISLFASRGRAPKGTDLNAPICLKSWPNFTRLLLSPGALRMAALWASHTFSISQVRKTLKLSRSDVLSFYSAAHAIGLIHLVEDGAKSESALPSSKAVRVKGLLGSILKKLHT